MADAVEAAIAQIERVEENVHSFVRIDKEGARKRAEEVQKMIDDGTLTGPLAGVPVAIKDNLCTKGVVLNKVERKKNSGYYNKYYGKEYKKDNYEGYYSSEEKKKK